MSIFSSSLVSFARRLTFTAPAALTSTAAPALTSTAAPALFSASTFLSSPASALIFSGFRSISSVTSTFAARSIQSPLISALPPSSSFLGAPVSGALGSSSALLLPGAVLVETKRFNHPSQYKPNAKKKRAKYSFHTRSQTAGGRACLWRRIIARKPRLAA